MLTKRRKCILGRVENAFFNFHLGIFFNSHHTQEDFSFFTPTQKFVFHIASPPLVDFQTESRNLAEQRLHTFRNACGHSIVVHANGGSGVGCGSHIWSECLTVRWSGPDTFVNFYPMTAGGVIQISVLFRELNARSRLILHEGFVEEQMARDNKKSCAYESRTLPSSPGVRH